MEEKLIIKEGDQNIRVKCNGWLISTTGYPIDPCEYEERGSWIDNMHKKQYQLLVCEKCGFPNIGWNKIGEEIYKEDIDEAKHDENEEDE